MQKHGASGCWTGNFLQALTSQHSERGVVLANLLRRFFEAFNFPVPPLPVERLLQQSLKEGIVSDTGMAALQRAIDLGIDFRETLTRLCVPKTLSELMT
jgi:hypothetical protein